MDNDDELDIFDYAWSAYHYSQTDSDRSYGIYVQSA